MQGRLQLPNLALRAFDHRSPPKQMARWNHKISLPSGTKLPQPPDSISSGSGINGALYERLNFNFARDIAPVAGLLRAPNVMEVHPSVPAKSVPEFIAYAKANPGKINYASAGTGTLLHVAGELFKMMTGVNLVHVPYRGGAPALTDL